MLPILAVPYTGKNSVLYYVDLLFQYSKMHFLQSPTPGNFYISSQANRNNPHEGQILYFDESVSVYIE
jgi:hypothetical protein